MDLKENIFNYCNKLNMGCCQHKAENAAEKFIVDFISSYKIFHLSFEEFNDLIEEFDTKVNLDDSTEALSVKKSISLNVSVQKCKLIRKFTQKQDLIVSLLHKNHKVLSLSNNSELALECNDKRDKSDKIHIEKIIIPSSSNKLKIKEMSYENFNSDNLYNTKLTKSLLKKKNSDSSNYFINSSINQPFKDSISLFINEKIFDKYSVNSNIFSLLINDFEKLNFNSYKIHLLSWAFGIVEHKNVLNDFYYIIDHLFKEDASNESIKEFIGLYLKYGILAINDICLKICLSNKGKIINGYHINNELIYELSYLTKNIFNQSTVTKYFNDFISLFLNTPEIVRSETLITFGISKNIIDKDNYEQEVKYCSFYLQRLIVSDYDKASCFLNIFNLRKLIIDNHKRSK